MGYFNPNELEYLREDRAKYIENPGKQMRGPDGGLGKARGTRVSVVMSIAALLSAGVTLRALASLIGK